MQELASSHTMQNQLSVARNPCHRSPAKLENDAQAMSKHTKNNPLNKNSSD
jgi:hypothetical protein